MSFLEIREFFFLGFVIDLKILMELFKFQFQYLFVMSYSDDQMESIDSKVLRNERELEKCWVI